jgi:peptidoglycan glycosyltransferase
LAAAIGIGYRFSPLITLRLNIWLNPWLDPQGNSFQIVQSLITIASGGLFGQGPGQGRPIYVPAVHTDFPFAAITEEYGFIGAFALLALFGLLVVRAWKIMRGTQSAYVMLLAGGIAVLIASQVFVIVGGNLGLIPLTGVTVPFISYGGSSLLVSFISIGLLIRMSSDNARTDHDVRQPGRNTGSSKTSTDILLRSNSKQCEGARYTVGILLVLLLSAAAVLAYWSLMHAADLTLRDDNPRKTDAERAIIRGDIVASDGALLAYSQSISTTSDYAPAQYKRRYPDVYAAPIVGYYSLVHGVGGIESFADTPLRGISSWSDKILHQAQVGQPYTTTIDSKLQYKVGAILSGTIGAAIVMDWHSGAVRALYSTPGYDPESLDQDWDTLRTREDAPLLNRATHGLYQPGALLKWFYTTNINQSAQVISTKTDWDTIDKFSLGTKVPFELDNAAVPYPVTGTYSETVGQGTLRVTPLRVAVTAAGLAANRNVIPHLTQFEADAASLPSDVLLAKYTGNAQSSSGRYVDWYVAIDATTVTVIALETASTDLSQLDKMVVRFRTKE